MAKNRESSRKGKIVSYHAVSEEWFFLASPALPPLEQLIEKEKIMELMELLTERQRNIVILYFYYGETQWEIAKALILRSEKSSGLSSEIGYILRTS